MLKVRFEKVEDEDGLWYVYNHKGEHLGEIFYKNSWKRWIFEPDSETYYSSECLEQIIEFLKKLDNCDLNETY